MIKVNLLKDVSLGAMSTGTSVDPASSSPQESPGRIADLIVKMAVLLIPLILVWSYRTYQMADKKNQHQKLTVRSTELAEKLRKMEPGLKDIEKFLEEKRKLDNQLNVIRQLSKERMKNVKSLDALQGIIPTKAWLTALRIIENRVELDGMASDDLEISNFMRDLEASIYFANVMLESSEEVKGNEAGPMKHFKIKCNLENL